MTTDAKRAIEIAASLTLLETVTRRARLTSAMDKKRHWASPTWLISCLLVDFVASRRKRCLSSFVELPSVAYPQNDNVTSLNIENNPVITDPESIRAELGIGQIFSIGKWICFISLERISNPPLGAGNKLLNVPDGSMRINELEFQSPKTSSWVFRRPAL